MLALLHGPSILLSHAVHALVHELPGVRDGSEEAIHQSRVAIRRVREALALVRVDYLEDAVAAIEARLRRAMRVLGRVRDADIGHRLIEHVETRFPMAPVALSRLSASIAVEQLRRRRKAIKALEELDLSALPEQLAHARRGTTRSMWDRGPGWRAEVRRHFSLRADEVRAAIQHASGVYFPNRVHAARVSIKQLRYTLELAAATRIWRAPRAVRMLRKAQDALGDAHDRQVLMARLDELAASSAEPIRAEVEAVEHFIRAEMLALHAKYLARRPDILAICDACDRAARGNGTARRALLVAGVGVGVPSLLLLRR